MGNKLVGNDEVKAVMEASGKTYSQYKSNVYERIKKDGLKDEFLGAIERCKINGYSNIKTCEELGRIFPEYCGRNFHTVTFNKMKQRYSEVRIAAEIGNDILEGIVYGKLREKIKGDIDKISVGQFIELLEKLNPSIFPGSNQESTVDLESLNNIRKLIESINNPQDGRNEENL